MFSPTRHDGGKITSLPAKGSITFVKGNALKNTGGYLDNAASGDNTDVDFICMENKVTGASDGEMLQVMKTRGGTEFVVDTSNTPTQAQMLVAVDLSAAGTIDTSATTDAVFFAEALVGPASAKKVLGYFVGGVVNS